LLKLPMQLLYLLELLEHLKQTLKRVGLLNQVD